MFKKTVLIIIALIAIFVFSKTSSGQTAHMGIYFSVPHIRITAGEPVYYPNRSFYPVNYYRYHRRVWHNYNYYPQKYYYSKKVRYRHDNGWHKGLYKHRHKR